MAGEPIDRNEKRPALERADASEQDSRAKKERASDWDFRSAEIAKRVGAFLPTGAPTVPLTRLRFDWPTPCHAWCLRPSFVSVDNCWWNPVQKVGN